MKNDYFLLLTLLLLTACQGTQDLPVETRPEIVVAAPTAPTESTATSEPVAEIPECLEIDYALPSLEEILDSAAAIVTGEVEALSEPGLSLTNFPLYEVTFKVGQVIRGTQQPGQSLTVVVGGNCPQQGFIQPGEQLLLFLEERPIFSDYLVLYPYGKYVLAEDGRLINAFDESLNTTLQALVAVTGEERQPAPIITVTEGGVSPGIRIIFRGSSSLPNDTCLRTQLYLSEEPIDWWPADQCAAVQNSRWQMAVSLGEGEAPAELDATKSYGLLVWQRDNPAVESEIFFFDIAGPQAILWRNMKRFAARIR